jgi:hypothetical protein
MKEAGIEAYHYFYHDKKVYLGLVDMYFPGFLKQYRQLEKKEERKRNISKLFNGNMLIEAFGLTGKDLGLAITNFKNYFANNNAYEDYILETNNIAEIKINTSFAGTPQRLVYSQDEINANGANVPSPLPAVTEKTEVHK